MPSPTMTRNSCVSIPRRFGGLLLRPFGTARIGGPARKIIGALILLPMSTAGAMPVNPYTREEGFDRPGADFETFEQDQVLDLYAHDIGQWNVGDSGIVAAVLLADGRRLAHTFTLEPLRGSGSFKFERARDGCLGEGL